MSATNGLCPSHPGDFIPFFLAHDRLLAARTQNHPRSPKARHREWFLKLIRHEAAHAYAYAYQFRAEAQMAAHLGKSSLDETPSFYRPASA